MRGSGERYQSCQENKESEGKVAVAWVIVFHGDRDRKGKNRSSCQS